GRGCAALWCASRFWMNAAEWNSASQQGENRLETDCANSIHRVSTSLSRRFQTTAGKRIESSKTLTHTLAQPSGQRFSD
ncbi:MAG: hypothetical protein ACOYZ8_00260, partial [Chloroflexota bacterium]